MTFRLPCWLVRNLHKSLRPRPSWSLRKAVSVELLKRISKISSRVDGIKFIANHTTVSRQPHTKHVWLNPVPPDLLSDKLRTWTADADVAPMSIPGYWFDKDGVDTPIGVSPRPTEKVIYSLHGGSYIRFSASPADINAAIVRGLLKHCAGAQRAFAVEYRLSRAAPEDAPAHAFPAALLDALAGYIYLVESVGFAPQDIIVEGDSAGGNLALALTRFLLEHVELAGVPAPPGALILLSPWVDLSTKVQRRPGSRAAANASVDYIGQPENTHYSTRAFLGPRDPLDPYISPGCDDPRMPHVSFEGFPRSIVVAGGAEVLIDEIGVLVERMKSQMGERVTYHEEPDEVHDYLLFPSTEIRGQETFRIIAQWSQADS